jgi:hypothetical protein
MHGATLKINVRIHSLATKLPEWLLGRGITFTLYPNQTLNINDLYNEK